MAYIVDLESRASKLLHMTVHPYGWVPVSDGGVEIEFGTVWLNEYDPEPALCMRVKGTEHCWAWFQHVFYQLSGNDYAGFFTRQLEEFRLEFLLWIHSPLYSGFGWVREYYEMFKGRFYDFSEEERAEFERAKSEWEGDQAHIDAAVRQLSELRNNGGYGHQV